MYSLGLQKHLLLKLYIFSVEIILECGLFWDMLSLTAKCGETFFPKMNETKRLVKEFYNIQHENIPETRERSKWIAENKCGFLLGILEFGFVVHKEKLNELLQNGKFKEQEMDFINEMYQFYIFPFKQHNGTGKSESSCHTPQTKSSNPSRQNSVEDLDYIPEEEEKEFTHKDLKKAVLKRDGVCLFCWEQIECIGSHIIAQKNVPFKFDETALFERTGLKQKHQVQNGLLLCANCHGEFDALKRYVDVMDDKLVARVVNGTNDVNICEMIKDIRFGIQSRIEKFRNREVVNTKGELELYFQTDNVNSFPNRKALEFHKAACLIWRMAGGGESDDEHCPDDELIFVPSRYDENKVRKWLRYSNDTLNMATI